MMERCGLEAMAWRHHAEGLPPCGTLVATPPPPATLLLRRGTDTGMRCA